MTKIAIISRPDQGVLIDIGGCSTINEATQHLTQTLQGAGQFWEDQPVDLNMGSLSLTPEEFSQVQAIFSESGVQPRNYFSQVEATRAALQAHKIEPSSQIPASLPVDADGMPLPAAATAPALVDCPPKSAINEAAADDASWTIDGAPESVQAAPAADASQDTKSDTTSDTTNSEKAPTPPAAPVAPPAPHVLFIKQTLRSGQAVSHKGHLIIVGDVNPGAEVMAEGDITIWGALRGVAHAGIAGNTNSEIRALRFDPIQLRIAHAIARAPDRPRGSLKSNGPETARIVNGVIRIASSAPE